MTTDVRPVGRRLVAVLTAVCAVALGLTTSGAAAASCPTLSYVSAPAIHAQRACDFEGVATHGTQPGTYLFLTPDGADGAGAGIYQDNGVLVWWTGGGGSAKDHDLSVVHYQGQPLAALWTGGTPAAGAYGVGSVTLYDQHYQVVGHITAGGSYAGDRVDLHEFTITPQGDALIGVYDPVQMTVNGTSMTVLQYVVQKLSLVRDSSGIHTGSVLFQWKSLSDVPVSSSHLPAPGAGGIYDYFHGNAIAQDSDGNLLVSARNTWGIYKINATPNTARYGHVTWQVGAPGDHTLSEPWCYQHNIEPLGNDEYSLYDDGGTGPGCLPGSTQHPARGLIVRVDPSTHPAGVSLVASYTHSPALLTGFTGSTQVLSNGDVLVDWANDPEITEYSSGGQVKMDLELSNWSYRGERFAWDGQPTQPPALAAQSTTTGTDVWASWNGSTEVTAWQLVAGSSPSHLSAVGAQATKTGFETELSTAGHYAYAAVQALDASGHVLSTSRAVPAAGYLLATSRGNVYNFGTAQWYGSLAAQAPPAPVVAIATAPAGGGYWLATSQGNVFNYGAGWYGSEAGQSLPAAVTGIAATPDGRGYWLTTAKGNVYPFGDAHWYGSENGQALPASVTGIAATPDGRGYWLTTAKGNVFNFGDAQWYGSENGQALPAAVVAITPAADGRGYWLTTSKGNVYNFGDAPWLGSKAGQSLPAPVVGMTAFPGGQGYWLTTSKGGVYAFGAAAWYGSETGQSLPAGVVGTATVG